MSTVLDKIWTILSEMPVGAWTTIVALITALVAAFVSLWSTRKIIGVQRESLNAQHLANARSASTFIAEKRQKWIDDLRTDASKYLSLSLEITEAWKQFYWMCNSEHDEHYLYDPRNVLRACEALRIKFINENAARDSEHHQIYMRILLRLNNDEDDHQRLMAALNALRTHMSDLAASALKGEYSNQELVKSVESDLDVAKGYTKIILKSEWQRLKREIADPDTLIFDILSATDGSKKNI